MKKIVENAKNDEKCSVLLVKVLFKTVKIRQCLKTKYLIIYDNT